MKKASLCALVGLLVAGCGGGDGASGATSGTTSNPSTPPVAQQLSQYIGTWTSACQDHSVETMVVTRTPDTTDSIDMAGTVDYFAAADCTGPLVATVTATASITSKFVATIDSSVVFTPASAGIISKIDQVISSRPQYSTVYTGPGVFHTVRSGAPVVCVGFSDGSYECGSEAVYAAQSGISEGLLLQGDTLYALLPSGSGYTVDMKFTKKVN